MLLEDTFNHVIQIHRKLKNAEKSYDNMMKELIIIQEKLNSAKNNKEEK